jgi:hypothetical protein
MSERVCSVVNRDGTHVRRDKDHVSLTIIVLSLSLFLSFPLFLVLLVLARLVLGVEAVLRLPPVVAVGLLLLMVAVGLFRLAHNVLEQS